MIRISFGLMMFVFLFSCQESSTVDQGSEEVEQEVHEEIKEQISFNDIEGFAAYCYQLLAAENYSELAFFSSEGILFSPYPYIHIETAQVLTPSELEENKEPLFWGYFDGSGDSILLTIPAYRERFLSTLNRTDAFEVISGPENPIARGNSLVNLSEVFPGASFVEYYWEPSEEGYLDWQGLLFIIEVSNDKYYLKGLVNNQWTI